MRKQVTNNPFIMPLMDGTFDCHYPLVIEKKHVWRIENIQGETAARIFCENKYCQVYIDKICRWQKHQAYIISKLPLLDYPARRREAITKLGEYVAKLKRVELNKFGLVYYLETYVIEMIEQARPGRHSKFNASTNLLLTELNGLLGQVSTKVTNP